MKLQNAEPAGSAGSVLYEYAMKRRVHKKDIYRESGRLRTENEGLMEDGLGALGVSQWLASDGSTHYSAELLLQFLSLAS